jgi:outer membrane protein TolC
MLAAGAMCWVLGSGGAFHDDAWAQTRTSSGRVALSLTEAVRTTLRLHPAIQSAASDVEQRKAELDVARGPFDPVVTTAVSHDHDTTGALPGERLFPERTIYTDTTDVSLGASVGTTWGTNIAPSVGLARVYQRLANPPPGLVNDPMQRAHVGLTVTQPLLRGAGTVGAASAIEARRLARDAAAHTLTRSAQRQVYLTLVAYYELVAANQDLGLLRGIRNGASKVVDDTKLLVQSEQRPRSDLRQLEGNLANRTRAVIEAENNRLQAVYALGLAMGLGADRIADFDLTDGFPPVSAAVPDGADAVRVAARDRADLAAARTAVASAARDLQGAEWNTKPSLDLSASVGYGGGLDRDGVDAFFLAAGKNVRGLNAGVALTLELPVANTAKRAERDLRLAQREQASIAARDLERRMPLDVMSALEDLRLSKNALVAANEAVKQFDQVVSDQRDKLREGVGTVIDMVLTEELLISAELRQTANQLRCAVAHARLLFEIGALPSSENDTTGALGRLLAPGAAQ